jgi:hypothetical protein
MDLLQWTLILSGTFILGLSKAGLKGIEMMNITIMALVFGGKSSTGVVLPLLCAADILAVTYYRRHMQWPQFWKIIPWMMAGVIIVLTVIIIVVMEFRKTTAVPQNKLFAASTGLAAGFTTMLGNLAGAFANIYFLALRMTKNDFIGTAAWVFLVINFFKLPFQVFYWKNISLSTLQTDLLLLPALVAGFFVGLKIVALIKDDSYRKFVIVLTFLGAIVIFFK